jgi:hypothetical protein
MEKPILKKYEVQIIGTAVVVANVFVEAISSEDAHEIARTSIKSEDFDVQEILSVEATESVEM